MALLISPPNMMIAFPWFSISNPAQLREKNTYWTSERLNVCTWREVLIVLRHCLDESMRSPCTVHAESIHQRAPKGTKGHQRARVVGSYSLIFSNSKKILGTPILRNTHWQSLQICCLDKSSERRLAHRIAAFQHISLDQKACRHELPKGQTTRSKKRKQRQTN